VLSRAAGVLLDHAPPEVKRRWLHQVRWALARHPFQVPPAGGWQGWVLQSGRGAGKTLTGANDVAESCLEHPGYRYGIVAPTLGDARDTCVEGETGVLAVLTDGNEHVPGMGLAEGRDFEWNRSLLELSFANGSHVKCFGTEKPDRLRGPQHHRLWFEELASFKDAWRGDVLHTAFNNAMLGLRLTGKGPTQYVVTTTPRPLKLMVDLVARPGVVVTRGTTYDNLANLSEEFAATVLAYAGTHLGLQELHGEIVTEDPDALWRWAWIDPHRLDEAPACEQVVVGVDPSGGAAEVGVVGAGRIASPCPCGTEDAAGPHFAVLADRSLRSSPEGWAGAVDDLYADLEADSVAAERNYGGDMVESTLRNANDALPVRMVNASRGKAVRAEPVVLMYEKGRVHHVGGFPELESEMTSWVPGSPWSPNRLDALVWSITELTGSGPQTRRARAPGSRSLVPPGR
jgi:phage terminase large subunit-like protein